MRRLWCWVKRRAAHPDTPPGVVLVGIAAWGVLVWLAN